MQPLARIRSLLRPAPTEGETGRRIHVCQLVERLELDGPSTVAATVANGLDSTSFLASCISVGARRRLALDRLAPRVEAWGLVAAEGASDPELARQVGGIVRRYRVGLLHAHGGPVLGLAVAAARRAGIPLVHTGYGVPQASPGAGVDDEVGLVAASRPAADEMVRSLDVPRERIAVIPLGVDTERFCPTQDRAGARQGLGLLPDELVLGGVGNADELSGLLDGLGAGRGLAVGEAAVAGRVLGVGWTRDMPSMLQAMDVFVCTSGALTPPHTLLEAMATGLAVVAVAGPAVEGLVRHGETGLVVPGADGLAEAVATLAQDPPGRRALGGAARAHVERHHDAAAMVDAHMALYRDAQGPAVS